MCVFVSLPGDVLTFHDGSAFDAQDVLASWLRKRKVSLWSRWQTLIVWR